MYLGRTTLSKFLIQQLTDIPDAGDLGALLVDVAAAVKAIAAMTAKGLTHRAFLRTSKCRPRTGPFLFEAPP